MRNEEEKWWTFAVRFTAKWQMPCSALLASKGHIFDSGNLHLCPYLKVSMKNFLNHTERKRQIAKINVCFFWDKGWWHQFGFCLLLNLAMLLNLGNKRANNSFQQRVPTINECRIFPLLVIELSKKPWKSGIVCGFSAFLGDALESRKKWRADCFIAQVFAFLPQQQSSRQ